MTTREKLELMKQMEADNAARMEDFMTGENMLIGVKVDTVTGKMYRAECPNSLDGIRELIGCEWIEAVPRMIGDRPFVVICDEEGRINGKTAISGLIPVGEMSEIAFIGDIFIISAEVDGDGEMVSLTDDDVAYVLSYGRCKALFGSAVREVLVCDYLNDD